MPRTACSKPALPLLVIATLLLTACTTAPSRPSVVCPPVVAYERARLRETGFKNLVGKIEWVAQDRGDAYGFHVRSFDEQGEPRSIIVKTTNYGARLPFSLTAAELALGLEQGSRVCIYRVYWFSRQPRLFVLPGPFESRLTLVPLEHRAVL